MGLCGQLRLEKMQVYQVSPEMLGSLGPTGKQLATSTAFQYAWGVASRCDGRVAESSHCRGLRLAHEPGVLISYITNEPVGSLNLIVRYTLAIRRYFKGYALTQPNTLSEQLPRGGAAHCPHLP